MISILEVYRRWPTHEACVAHLETVRWGFPAAPICPYCCAQKAARHVESTRTRWQCWGCQKSFSVTVGTIFHNTHVDLQRWFLLISLMLNAKKGLSAMQAARDIETRRATVWSMMHRIRKALKDDGQLLKGLVEMDEAMKASRNRGFSLEALKRPKFNPDRAEIEVAIRRFKARGGKIERLPDFTPMSAEKLASLLGAGVVLSRRGD